MLNSLVIVAPPPLRPVSPAETLQYFMRCSVLVVVYETAKNKKPQNSKSFLSLFIAAFLFLFSLLFRSVNLSVLFFSSSAPESSCKFCTEEIM